jgi:hypothetical protein|tara:strand:+ start:700 stop:870 length:171 start_codon:yes stop_codon:yes gene_type:complete
MKDVKTRWAVYDEGLKVWYDGELVAKIDPSQFKYILAELALWLKHNSKEEDEDGSI